MSHHDHTIRALCVLACLILFCMLPGAHAAAHPGPNLLSNGGLARGSVTFDTFALLRPAANQAPTINPAASVTGGAAPLRVRFAARAADADGTISTYQWLFGDGTEARIANPTHTYQARGNYQVTLNVWDNDGAIRSAQLRIGVTDDTSPTIDIVTPSGTTTHTTRAVTLVLAGIAATTTGVIDSVYWDNLRTGQSGTVTVMAAARLNWTTPPIELAPGRNEILMTVIDNRGRAATDRLIMVRHVSGPQISAVRVATTRVRQYERYQVDFQVATVSAHPLFTYDEKPPPGVMPGIGITVEGVITTPSGRIVRQPAFYREDATRETRGDETYYAPAGATGWSLRYAPVEPGEHRVALHARDASGSTSVVAGRFTALPPERKGFIGVSAHDSRYFTFSNGEIFWPIGPAWAGDPEDGQGFNFDRPWLAGSGIYSSNWARWKSTAEQLGNEGFSSRLSFQEHYPGHELSQELFYPDGYRMWLGSFIDDAFAPRLMPDTDYQISIRLKTVDLAGPRDKGQPYGLVVKLHDWPEEPGFERANRANHSLIPRISVNRDWHTVVATYRTGDDEGAGQPRADLSIYLENVTAGRAYIDAFSVREILPGGRLGPELIRNPRADLHTYVEQRPAAAIDDHLAQAERAGIFFKVVVHDKNDWIQNHLLAQGIFADTGDGYYQPRGTKARWLLEQWWRYIIARWGYSTAVHSWELNNEGPPDDGSGDHAWMAQEFARFMDEHDAHPHMATTSFWCCWQPAFWGDRARFPNIDYADIHEYPQADTRFADGTPVAYDVARFQAESSLAYAASGVGMPIMRGEVGFLYEPVYSYLARPNPGVWFHNLLWAQLNAGALFDPGYWDRAHMEAFDAASVAAAFARFVDTLDDLPRGGYGDAAPGVSNRNLRVYGQTNPATGRAHLWVQNTQHTWRNVMGVEGPRAVTPQSGTVTIAMGAVGTYTVEWWDTATGTVRRSEALRTDSQGRLTLWINALRSDLALKIRRVP